MEFEDGESVVFDRAHLRTHALDALSTRIYKAIMAGAVNLEALMGALRVELEDWPAEDARRRIEATLEELDDIGLLPEAPAR